MFLHQGGLLVVTGDGGEEEELSEFQQNFDKLSAVAEFFLSGEEVEALPVHPRSAGGAEVSAGRGQKYADRLWQATHLLAAAIDKHGLARFSERRSRKLSADLFRATAAIATERQAERRARRNVRPRLSPGAATPVAAAANYYARALAAVPTLAAAPTTATLAVTKQGGRTLPQRERPRVTVPVGASLSTVVARFCASWLEELFADDGGGGHDEHLWRVDEEEEEEAGAGGGGGGGGGGRMFRCDTSMSFGDMGGCAASVMELRQLARFGVGTAFKWVYDSVEFRVEVLSLQ